MTTATATTDVPDTERCHTWHANRHLTAHGHQPQPCDSQCCDKTEETRQP